MDNFLVCGSPVTVLKDGDGPVIFFVTDRGEEAQVLPELEAQTGPVLSWQVPDWNRDLSPWSGAETSEAAPDGCWKS